MTSSYRQIGEKINLLKIPPQKTLQFSFNSSSLSENDHWIRELLMEMNEKATHKTPEELLKETSLLFEGEIIKKDKPDLGEILILKGHLSGTYATECVRTLHPMTMNFDLDLKVVFVEKSVTESEEYQEVDETYIENDTYDIYVLTKRMADLKEMVHEQIFLHYDPYPVFDTETKIQLS